MTAGEDDVEQQPDDAALLRRRLLAMGGVLVEVTSDETDHGWGESREPDAGDARLRREVPPHHGG